MERFTSFFLEQAHPTRKGIFIGRGGYKFTIVKINHKVVPFAQIIYIKKWSNGY